MPNQVTCAQVSGKAVASIWLGFLSLGLSCLAGIPAVVFGVWSLRDISLSGGCLKGKLLAAIGIILGTVGSAALPGFIYFAQQRVQKATSERVASASNLKLIGLALREHQNREGSLPQAALKEKNGNPGLSWRVAILPYIEQEHLYQQFKLNEPWDSPNNTRLLTRMPEVFGHPKADRTKTTSGFTHYRAFVGPGAAFDPTLGRGAVVPADFPDGLGNTFLVVEAAEPIEWTRPDDLEYNPKLPVPELGGLFKSGFLAAMADGSVVLFGQPIDENVIRAYITRNGNEPASQYILP